MHSQSAVIKLATPCGDVVSPRPHIIFLAASPPKPPSFSSACVCVCVCMCAPLSLSSSFILQRCRSHWQIPPLCYSPAYNPFVTNLWGRPRCTRRYSRFILERPARSACSLSEMATIKVDIPSWLIRYIIAITNAFRLIINISFSLLFLQ